MTFLRTLIFFIITASITKVSYSQNIQDYFQLGKNYFKQGEYTKAKAKFTYVVSNNKMYYEAYTYRARCYIELNQNDSALVDFETALKRNPEYLPALYYRAAFYKENQQYAKALKDLDKVIANKPKYTPAILKRAEIYKLQNKPKLAFDDYSAAIKSGTKNSEIYYWRSVYYYDNIDFNNSLVDIDKAIYFKNTIDKYYYHKGLVLQSLGRKNLAISEYSKCISLNSEYQQAYERRAYLLMKTSNYEKAIEDNNYLVSHFHLRHDTLLLNNGKMEMELQNWTAADRYFIKTLSVNSKNNEALLGRARLNIKKGKPSSAISYLKRILRNDPKNAKAYFELGKIYFIQKNLELALDNLSKSLKIEESGEVLYYRASVYYEMKESSKACNDIYKSKELGFQKAIETEKVFCR